MLVLFMALVWMIKLMIVYQFLVGLEVFKVVSDEFLGWTIMSCDLKIPSLLLWFLLSSMIVKSIVVIVSLI